MVMLDARPAEEKTPLDGNADGLGQATPPVRREQERIRQLRVMKQRATALLVAMTALFFVITIFGGDRGWWGYLKATVEASMVGGLADWFAVTAVFRHPLGIPIPHTAVIQQRKDQFGATLAEFVQQNFLSPEVIGERLQAWRIGDRAAAWLTDRPNAEKVAEHGANLLVALGDTLRDDDVHRVLEEQIERAVGRLDVSVLAGRALKMVTAEERHQELFDVVLRGLERFLEENRDALRARFDEESPWWLPEALDERIFTRLFDGVRNIIADVNADPRHEVRARFDEWAAAMAERLEHDPDLQRRGEKLKRELLEHPELRRWSAALWSDVKTVLREQAGDPDSELRRRLADAVCAAGHRLQEDPALAQKTEELAESAARYLAEHFHDEIESLVSSTIERWDAEETARKLELLLGRDLQFIRINGTVVGGLAGLVIYAVGHAIS
jgi:uncharacterized membrane-anchored protein YjiN (DUF445 family)